MKKMYIAVLDEVPDGMVPTLVAHSVINAHIYFTSDPDVGVDHVRQYEDWLENSFKKVTLRVNRKEFAKISELPCWLGHENTTLNAEKSCAVVLPITDANRPNVLKYAKMWKPKPVYLDLVWDGFQSGPYNIEITEGGLAHLYYYGNIDEDGNPEYLQGGYLTLISVDDFKKIANNHARVEFMKRAAID